MAIITFLTIFAVAGAATSIASGGATPIDGPEVTIDGQILRVGRAGHVSVAHPGDECQDPRIFLLDPLTSQVWAFDRFDGLGSATPLAIVPGATDLALSTGGDGCAVITAEGPAGSVELR